MLFTVSTFLLPPLLVFGVYHLLTWFNVFRINERIYWKRVALAAAISHFFLATGFFVFLYFDFQAHLQLEALEMAFGPFVFYRSDFWRVMVIFDSLPMLVILGLFALLARAGVNPPGLLIVTFAITYLIGTLQWFLLGGGIGAVLQRFWSGLKTPDEEDEDWL